MSTIAYIAQLFPSLSMTFVYREVEALREKGVQVATFSIWNPRWDRLSAEAQHLVDSTSYFFPVVWSRFFFTHLRTMVTRPLRYWGTLLFLLSQPGESLKNRIRTFYHFCEAVYLAPDVRRSGAGHIHSHFALNSATVAMTIARLLDISFSFTAHANDVFRNPILLRQKIRAARFVIVISEYNREYLYNLVPEPETARKMHLVRYGVDVHHFSPSGRQARNERPVILSVSRLAEKKGLPYLIKACKRLVDADHDFRCLIVGEGSQRPLLEQLISDNDLAAYVSLEGIVFQERLKDYLEQATVFVLPSIVAADGDRDGIPNTLIEAMAIGIPAVSTTVSGIPELIEHEHTGLLVPEKDDRALAEALGRLLDDDMLRRKLGHAGRQKIEQEYSLDRNVEKLKTIFERYLPPPSEVGAE
jgi:colanic acid/amylovoran biosynthesis glycosyltransferase